MKVAMEHFRHWLERSKHPFTVLTDHRNLEYMRSAKHLNHRHARWALFFTRFQFTVTSRPGSKNTKADALSRQFGSGLTPPSNEPILPSTIILAPVQWNIMSEITDAQQEEPSPADCPASLTYVPTSLRQRVIHEVHTSPRQSRNNTTCNQSILVANSVF